MDPRQTLLIARYSARYSLRGGVGLVFLLLSLTFGLMVAHFMLQAVTMGVEEVTRRSPSTEEDDAVRRVHVQLIQQARPAVAWVLTSKSEAAGAGAATNTWVDFLLLKRPAMLSAIFLILMWGWPFIVACGTFDLYAGDIASRQLRYQLLRADRGSIFVGRLLGTLVTFICVLLLIGTIVPLYMGFKLPVYSWGSLCGWSLYGTVAMIVMSLPYIALCAWISAAVGSAFGSLTIASVVIGGVPLIVTLGGGLTPEFARWLKYALPWGYQTRLFHHEPLQVAAAAAGCVAMTALFLWLGYRKFTRRDL